MPIEKVFVGWDKPALPRVVDHLVDRYRIGSLVDLSSCLIVVPGSRAGRRLNELLLRRAESADWSIFPAITTTMGQFPEMLYDAKLPFAPGIVQDLAWAKALRETPRERLRHVMADIPDHHNDPRWMELGTVLRNQHRELAGDGLDFSSVASTGQRLEGFNEFERWQTLVQIQQAYLRILDGLNLWDRQTARLVAIEKRECRTDRDILLIATADMNRAMRDMLDQVHDRVTSLIFAPTNLADHFDSHGCIVPEAWQDCEIKIADERIHYVEAHAEQGQGVLRAVGSFDERYSADEITVGVPDETVVPHIEVALQQVGINVRWGPGRPIEASRPVRLLRCLVDYLKQRDFANLAELVRHPDIGHWLRSRHIDNNQLLDQLDEYQNRHLPTSVESITIRDAQLPLVSESIKAIGQLVQPLSDTPRHPDEWAKPLRNVLIAIYGERTVDTSDPASSSMLTVFDAIRKAMQQIGQVPDELISAIAAEQAILMVLREMGSKRTSSPTDNDSIELVGWLDLFLDDAPAAIVTSFNEGFVPSSIDSDLFLPNKLRSELGIDDSQRLFARDVYSTSALVASREDLHIVLARRSGNGDPVSPSRLLFAADRETILRRSLRFFGEIGEKSVRSLDLVDELPRQHQFFVPAPRPLDHQITTLRVTDFRSYLACPYRFYLKQVLRISRKDDNQFELDAAAFGSLMHVVLDQFGVSDRKDSTNPVEIAELFDDAIDRQAKQRFGRHVRAAVRVQIEQLRVRLRRFAQVQAARRADDWRIFVTEGKTGDLRTEFVVDGKPIVLKGRIDRIDYHGGTNTFAILDYKSADSGKSPEQAHVQSGEWIDLQLPLYRHLVKALMLNGQIELGYVLLPRDLSKVAFTMADWDEAALLEADEVARGVVREIRKQRFWPPSYPPPAFAEEFAGICQDDVFDRRVAAISVV